MRQRVLTALVLLPCALCILLAVSPVPTIVLGAVLTIVGSAELQNLFPNIKRLPILGILSYGLAVTMLMSVPSGRLPLASAMVALGFIGITSAQGSNAPTRKNPFLAPILGELSSLWIAMPMAACVLLQRYIVGDHQWLNMNLLMLALVPVWAGDTAAIFVGRYFGRHPMAPKISPKKTWEGAIANLCAAIAAGTLLASSAHVSIDLAAACGASAGILGQAGDLFESLMKRRADMKDSGSLLPGHGGVLDRIDSVLFTVPFVALLITAFA